MHALVVYESMYGNTHVIANCIAEGLRERHDVTILPVSRATIDMVGDCDFVVAGGPTHIHGLASSRSRRMAADVAAKPGSGLSLEPGSTGPGLREWLHKLQPGQGRPAAAFDTRLEGYPLLTGRASTGITHRLRGHGYRLAAAPKSFLITKQNTLVPGEAERARAWGAALADAWHPVTPAAS